MDRHYLSVSFLSVIVIFAALTLPAHADVAICLDDGAHHVIDGSNSYPNDRAVISNSTTGIPTTVDIQTGGGFGGTLCTYMAHRYFNSTEVFSGRTLQLVTAHISTFSRAASAVGEVL